MEPLIRIWHGETSLEKADEFASYARETGVRDIRATPGNLGLLVLRRKERDVCHFWFVSAWESMESVKRFAGDVPEKPWYYPRDKELLLTLEDRVIHCETVFADLMLALPTTVTNR